MNFFEFILVITSVIYALCMAPLLSGFVRILQFDGDVKHFLPQAIISLVLYILVPMLWWTMWVFRDTEWQLVTYLYMIVEPTIMFVACSLIFPQRIDGGSYDMEEHYYKIRIPLLTSILILAILMFADGVVFGTESVWNERRYIQVFWLLVLVWALIDKRRLAQYAAALIGLFTEASLLLVWFWLPPG
jgi:hypothetical protein